MSELKLAVKIIKQTNKLLAEHFLTLGLLTVRFKKNEEIVTEADFEANKLITSKLLRLFPDDDIVSEEAVKIDNPGRDTWYIDPLDGTTNFAYGFRDFATILAKISPEKTELGVIGLPLAKEIYWAEYGKGAFLNGKPIKVSSRLAEDRGIVLICGGHTPEQRQQSIRIIDKMGDTPFRFRVLSSAGVETTAVACGRSDGYISTGIKPWDVLAGVLLIREAGGRVTNLNGDEWTISDSTIVASNGLIHEDLLNLV